MGPPFRLLLLHTRIIRQLFSSYQGHPRICVYSQNHGANFIRIGPPPSCCSYSGYQYNCFWSIGPPPGCTHKNHASDTGGGWAAFQIVALTHKNNRVNFSSYQGTSRFCVYSQNHGAEFYSDRPTASCCSYSQSYQYNCFFGVSPQGCCSYSQKIMHPTPAADGPAFRIVALTHKNNRDNFFIVSGPPRICVYSQNHGAEFYSDRPTMKLLLVLTKFINTTVLSIGPPPRCCSYSHKVMHPTYRRMDVAPFRLLSYTQE
jgi:hypothetical protein